MPGSVIGMADKAAAAAELKELVAELSVLQNHLFAEAEQSLLVVLQGMDASGKDGTIRRVFTGVNPQGCDVTRVQLPVARRARPRLPLARSTPGARGGARSASGTGRTTKTS